MTPPPSFKKLSEKIKTSDPDDAPDEFVREVHAAWKKEGGTLAGKPRHSDRYLFDQLRERGASVKSLTPKLTGKTRIRPKDGATLLHFFLSQWPFPPKDGAKGQAGEDDLSYRPLLPSSDVDAIADYISKQLSAEDIPVDEVSHGSAIVESLPGRISRDLNAELFAQCEVMIVVSTENSLIVATPKTELIGFRDTINRFWITEKEDEKKRPLIWVLDLGRQDFEDVNARAAFMNVQALMTRFKALRDFDERQSKERWEWLKSRVVIVLLDTRHEEEIPLNRVRRPFFLAHHVNLTAVAPLWLSLPRFRGLYGSNLERLDDRSFSVFYNSSEWEKSPDDNEIRYVGHALFYLGPREKGDRQLRGIELPSPGQNYDEAFKTVYAAAMHKLGLPLPESADLHVGGKAAIEQLNYLGFLVLSLDDFLKDY